MDQGGTVALKNEPLGENKKARCILSLMEKLHPFKDAALDAIEEGKNAIYI